MARDLRDRQEQFILDHLQRLQAIVGDQPGVKIIRECVSLLITSDQREPDRGIHRDLNLGKASLAGETQDCGNTACHDGAPFRVLTEPNLVFRDLRPCRDRRRVSETQDGRGEARHLRQLRPSDE
jgi:hypothetical protein